MTSIMVLLVLCKEALPTCSGLKCPKNCLLHKTEGNSIFLNIIRCVMSRHSTWHNFQGQWLALDYLNNFVPSYRKLAIVMVGLAPRACCFQIATYYWWARVTFSPKASFVGGRLASLGGTG